MSSILLVLEDIVLNLELLNVQVGCNFQKVEMVAAIRSRACAKDDTALCFSSLIMT